MEILAKSAKHEFLMLIDGGGVVSNETLGFEIDMP
jgi:hypothetical protein